MLKKIIFGLLLVILLVVGVGFIYVQLSWDKTYDIAYPDLKISMDSAVIARGEYLVTGPSHCTHCHVSGIEDAIKSEQGEMVSLSGGFPFHIGPLATLYSANLTPDKETGIGRYEDGEIFRMMQHSVKPDGSSSLALLMPFWNMAEDDMIAIVSYLRSQGPVRNEVPKSEYSFLGKAIKTFTPVFDPIRKPSPSKVAPEMAPTLERGEYLARYGANCVGCHTNRDLQTMEQIGEEYAGGFEFEPDVLLNEFAGVDPNMWTRSANITPAEGSALSKYTSAENWISRFRQGRVVLNSPMPWGAFAKMTNEDLTAIYVYLNSLKPVDNDPNPSLFIRE